MSTWLKLSFKNLWRHKHRTILDIAAIAINLGVIIFYVCLYRGYVDVAINNVIDFQTGHYQIHQKDYLKEEKFLPLDLSINNATELQKKIQSIPGISEIAKRIEFKGTLSNGLDRMPVFGVGFEPQREKKIGVIHKAIYKGQYLDPDKEEILIGKQMAEVLDLKVGDYVFLYGRTKLGVHNLMEIKIKGIFELGFSLADKTFVYIPFKFANKFFTMGDAATELIIRKDPSYKLIDLENKISEKIDPQKNVLHNWKYFAKPILQDIKMDSIFMVIFFLILLALAIFGILNTISMGLIERTKEIGTLRAIGYSKKHIRRLLLTEVTILGLTGGIIGCFIGFLLSLWMVEKGIYFGSEFTDMLTVPIPDTFYGEFGWEEYVGSMVIALFAALLGGILPILKMQKQKVIDCLGHN